MKRAVERAVAMPHNHWAVYEVCKAAIDYGFLELTGRERMEFLKRNLPGVPLWTIKQGLAEFESVPEHNWVVSEPRRVGLTS